MKRETNTETEKHGRETKREVGKERACMHEGENDIDCS